MNSWIASNNTGDGVGVAPGAGYRGRMPTDARAGRPRATSRETIAEAACELFLERGYEETSIADIARRAGVSRSSFFNYVSSKSDLLWGGFDERMDAAIGALARGQRPLRTVLAGIGVGFAPDSLALAVVNAEAMGLVDEIERERAVRLARLARAVARYAARRGTAELPAEVLGAAAAGAVLAAVWSWALEGGGRRSLSDVLDEALDAVPGLGGGSVREPQPALLEEPGPGRTERGPEHPVA